MRTPITLRGAELLREELALAMALCGKPNLDSLSPSLLRM